MFDATLNLTLSIGWGLLALLGVGIAREYKELAERTNTPKRYRILAMMCRGLSVCNVILSVGYFAQFVSSVAGGVR